MFRGQKGITLVALVITIIVLLILAGVTIAALSGDNGILTNASKSQQENALGNAKDTISMAINEATNAYYSTTYLNETNGNVVSGQKASTAIVYIWNATKNLTDVKVTIGSKVMSEVTQKSDLPTIANNGASLVVKIQTTDNNPVYTQANLNNQGGLDNWSKTAKVTP